jgi:hypothetical protein
MLCKLGGQVIEFQVERRRRRRRKEKKKKREKKEKGRTAQSDNRQDETKQRKEDTGNKKGQIKKRITFPTLKEDVAPCWSKKKEEKEPVYTYTIKAKSSSVNLLWAD